MDPEIVDASPADPSSAPSEPVDPAQAPSQPAQQQPTDPDANVPFHRHPRFQQLIRENQSYKTQMGQMQQRLQQLESLSQQSQQPGGLSREEQQQYSEAATALKKILAADPELKQLLGMTKQLPQFAQVGQTVQRLSQTQVLQHQKAATSHINDLVKEAGIAVDKKHLPHINRLVVGAAMSLPDGEERYQRGDFSVFTDAFEDVKSFIEGFRKAGATATAQTKDKLKTLPKPSASAGAPGPAAPEKPQPGQERDYTESLHQRGLAMLREKLTG